MDISRPCQPEKLIPLLPWPGFDPSFSGHNDRRAIISEWTRLRLRPLNHRGWREGRRRLDEADRRKIAVELLQYIHPLNDQQPGVYNICNGQVVTDTVYVQNALAIGSEQSRQFSTSLSSEFHKTIKKKVKTMESVKKAVNVKRKALYDIETLFSRLLVVGQ